MPPSWGAGALLHPGRRIVQSVPQTAHDQLDVAGDGVNLKTWWFRAPDPRRGTVIFLHGVGDNRGSGAGIAARFVPAGWDVIAYDSRAHGESTGAACTYGYYEKHDLARVLDRVERKPIVVIGTSLGAAVALQAAAEDQRIAAVVAVAPFSDLRTAASERAPFFASRGNIEAAFQLAQKEAAFEVGAVSPLAAAARIRAPVLLIHGGDDRETPVTHSRRIDEVLTSPRRLIVVPHAGHSNCLTGPVWHEIDGWLEAKLPGRP